MDLILFFLDWQSVGRALMDMNYHTKVFKSRVHIPCNDTCWNLILQKVKSRYQSIWVSHKQRLLFVQLPHPPAKKKHLWLYELFQVFRIQITINWLYIPHEVPRYLPGWCNNTTKKPTPEPLLLSLGPHTAALVQLQPWHKCHDFWVSPATSAKSMQNPVLGCTITANCSRCRRTGCQGNFHHALKVGGNQCRVSCHKLWTIYWVTVVAPLLLSEIVPGTLLDACMFFSCRILSWSTLVACVATWL